MNPTIEEVKPGIFLLSFDDHYDLAMTFLRFSEFYENPVWREKVFTLVDFMEWYAKEHGKGAFTYPKDWAGFNVSSKTLIEYPWAQIQDFNKYDELMHDLVFDELVPEHGINWYLIGAKKGSHETMKHEIAHGFFSSNWAYRNEMIYTIEEELSDKHVELMTQWLNENMYHETVHLDEIQAYFATGLTRDQKSMFRKAKISTAREEKLFKRIFKAFYGSDNKTIPERSRTAA